MTDETKNNDEIIKKEKPQINREKIELLKSKFNILRKVKPLKFKRSKIYEKFDPRKIDPNKIVDINSIWEKTRKERTVEEKFYYRREARAYHKYFFLYLSREVRRTRWTPRKELNKKFWITVLFITFFAGLFALLDAGLVLLFRALRIT